MTTQNKQNFALHNKKNKKITATIKKYLYDPIKKNFILLHMFVELFVQNQTLGKPFTMKTNEIRSHFTEFFKKNNHTIVPSSSLIPADDPTLLFANAGMNQFKDVFIGKETRPYKRASSVQRCIRAGGKHNDLDNVGFTARHLTFFEMLGNFSFGDYFKEEAIQFAWDLLTKDLKLDAQKLYASIHISDDEAYDIWHTQIGLPANRIVRLGDEDNFWQMGDVGPCGPCTEIYVDRGEAFGTGPDNAGPGCSGDRFIEIWNLVFMQYNKQADGTLVKLQKTGVDTGMGLERIAMIMQDKSTVFDSDVFEPILTAIGKTWGTPYEKAQEQERVAFRVIADHTRSSVLAIVDGGEPSNDGRGYVIRKIIRRAALFAQKVGGEQSIYAAIDVFIDTNKDIYPGLFEQRHRINKIMHSELDRFAVNLTSGTHIFNRYADKLAENGTISGEQAFMLYDTYGFPLEVTRLLAHERGLHVDLVEFENNMNKQREQSAKKHHTSNTPTDDYNVITSFVGYEQSEAEGTIKKLLVETDGAFTSVSAVPAGTHCFALVDTTPLYAECGGQVQDRGTITYKNSTAAITHIVKVGSAIALGFVIPQEIAIDSIIMQKVDTEYRRAIECNHTATHILQSALVKELGSEIKQAGSSVNAEQLRFDFTYHQAVSADVITEIETYVNKIICENHAVHSTNTTLKEALAKGATAFFGDKYNPQSVRVVTVPGISAELCGGTHVQYSGEIGSFKIIESIALSAGTRRIIACTAANALAYNQKNYAICRAASTLLKVEGEEIIPTINKLSKTVIDTQKKYTDLSIHYAATLYNAIKNSNATKEYDLCVMDTIEQSNMAKITQTISNMVDKKPAIFIIHDTTKATFAIIFPKDLDQCITDTTQKLTSAGFRCGGQKKVVQGGFSLGEKTIEQFEKVLTDTLHI